MKQNTRPFNKRVNNRGNKNNDLFPVRVNGLKVRVDKHKSFDAAMNKWMRMVQEDGKLDELRERRFFEKPTDKRRRRKAKALLKERYRRENEDRDRSR